MCFYLNELILFSLVQINDEFTVIIICSATVSSNLKKNTIARSEKVKERELV